MQKAQRKAAKKEVEDLNRLEVQQLRELAGALAGWSVRLADECDREPERMECAEIPENEGTARPGWYLKTLVCGDRVHVYLLHDGSLEATGVSSVKPGLPDGVAISQAMSYAAHLIYKTMQRREEFAYAEPSEKACSQEGHAKPAQCAQDAEGCG